MFNAVHSDRIERWLGTETANDLSRLMAGSYFDPITVAMGPGGLRVSNDGDYVGKFSGGYAASYLDWVTDQQKRETQRRRVRMARHKKQLGAIGSLSDLYADLGAGKRQAMNVAKTGVTGVANISNSLWDVGAQPSAGGTSAAGAGSSPTNTTTGGLYWTNPSGGDSTYFLGATIAPTVANNFLLLYDRFFQVNHSLATDPQAISGTPTRYQATTARGTFLSIHVTSALGAGTPTYTVQYVDSEGNTAENSSAQTIVGSAIARRFPFAASVGNGWYFPLNAGDMGVREVDNLDLSATSTGNVDIVLGKPIAWIPQPFANVPVKFDASMSPADMTVIADSACLAFMEINKGATTATSYSGSVAIVQG